MFWVGLVVGLVAGVALTVVAGAVWLLTDFFKHARW